MSNSKTICVGVGSERAANDAKTWADVLSKQGADCIVLTGDVTLEKLKEHIGKATVVIFSGEGVSLKDVPESALITEIKCRREAAKEKAYDTWSQDHVSENGVSVKDLLVIVYWNQENHGNQVGYHFSLVLKKNWAVEKIIPDDFEIYNDFASILPGNFGECCENTFEYNDGTSWEGVKLLKRCGFKVVKYDWNTEVESELESINDLVG
jgi:hypothetical protein